MPIVLPASLATAAACAILNLWLAIRVGQMRRAHKVSVGDGGNIAVIARMRAHANFIEYAPIVLILLALVELARGTSILVWSVGFVFVVGRICHGVGMDSWKPGRAIGVLLTGAVTLALAAAAVWTIRERPMAAHGGGAIQIEQVPAA